MGVIKSINGEAIDSTRHLAVLIRALFDELLDERGSSEVLRAGDLFDDDWLERDKDNVFVAIHSGGTCYRIALMRLDDPISDVIDMAYRVGQDEAEAALRVMLARQKENREAKWASKHPGSILVPDDEDGDGDDQDGDDDED